MPLRVRSLLKNLLGYVAEGAIVGMGALGVSYPRWERYFAQRAEERIRSMEQQLHQKMEDTQSIVDRACALYDRSQNLYRPLLGLASVKPEDRYGAMGGAPITIEEQWSYQTNLVFQEYNLLVARLKERSARLRYLPCISPVQGVTVSGYGYRDDPFFHTWRMHTGVDIAAPYGAPVRAAADGKVVFAGWDTGGYGLQVEVDHGDGLVTKYAHLSRLQTRLADSVRRGQVIGFVGSTGYSVGPHLHYEVIERGVKVNPQKYLLLP
ncbi:MAG: M23 family metallopeptidase [Bacteroidia bacterium]|nr:M23 family metallopeptidase [Bacteroidia bacterium]